MAPVRYHDGRFPASELGWPRLIPYIRPAPAAVARYDGLLTAVPSPGRLAVSAYDPGGRALVAH